MKEKLCGKIGVYLAKTFLLRFLQLSLAFSLLIFFVNFIELLNQSDSSNMPTHIAAFMAFLHIPDFLDDIAPSIVLFAGILTFFLLSLKSEITIIRSCGFSLWNTLFSISVAAFLLGIFWVLVFLPMSIQMTKKYNVFESKYIALESRESALAAENVWLKQFNQSNTKEEVIIYSQRVYRENAEFVGVTIWFFSENGEFYRKLDARTMNLENKKWLLQDVIINDDKYVNHQEKKYEIPTNLEVDFVMDKIVSNFQNVKLFSIFSLPSLIKSLELAGFQSTKFEVYFQGLLSKPFLFMGMVLISCYFGINNFRNQMALLKIFVGVIFGLALYITLSVISALGASKFVPVFAATWVITFICLAIGVLLIYRKESA